MVVSGIVVVDFRAGSKLKKGKSNAKAWR